jgi:glycosyltransferase involved in cell wall biosynthesis
MKNKIRKLKKFYNKHGLWHTIKKIISVILGKPENQNPVESDYKNISLLVNSFDLSTLEIEAQRILLKQWENKPVAIKTINWLVPGSEYPLYGGIYTIYRFADFFQENGIENRIIIYDQPNFDTEKLISTISGAFPLLAKGSRIIIYDGELDSIPECDAAIATLWPSAYFLTRLQKTKRKFYFIQDFEPLFYNAGSLYGMAEMTYRLGLTGIVNTPGLEQLLKEKYRMKAISFIPSTDSGIYHISETEIAEKMNSVIIQIVTYGRPAHGRNAFELSLAALIKLKEQFAEKVNIISVGADWDENIYGVKGVVTNLGRLSNLNEVAALYRKSHIGLSLMFTPHPSYQPFEYMSCGCAVVANWNAANLWLFKDYENALLAEPTPAIIAEKIAELVSNPELRKKLLINGLNTVKANNWNDEMRRVLDFMLT